jgi:hypothetical protein
MSMTLNSFCHEVEIKTLPIGVYDAPDPEIFAPLVPLKRCIFDHYQDFQSGAAVVLDETVKGCPGCGYWMLGKGRFPSREAMVTFLTDKEGLRENAGLTEAWLDAHPTFEPRNGHIVVGPVSVDRMHFLRTVTFFVNADQLSVLIYGANYHARPSDPEPVLAPWGSGCGQLYSLFPSLSSAQAIIGATDVAMRPQIPPDLLSFTVTVPMLDRLLSLDDGHSFLSKPFLSQLKLARKG